MVRLILGTLVFSGLFFYCLRQLYRGIRHGTITAWSGSGKTETANETVTYFCCRRASQPLVFWHAMVWYVLVAGVAYWIVSTMLIKPYVWGEVAPEITSVQPYNRYDLQIYWDRPDRFDDPVEYIVYRLGGPDGRALRVGNRIGGPGVRQFVDEHVEAGTTYTYRVEARYSGLTAWIIGDKPTTSEPVSGTTYSW